VRADHSRMVRCRMRECESVSRWAGFVRAVWERFPKCKNADRWEPIGVRGATEVRERRAGTPRRLRDEPRTRLAPLGLLEQAAQHPGGLFVDLHPLSEKVAGRLIVRGLGGTEDLACGA